MQPDSPLLCIKLKGQENIPFWKTYGGQNKVALLVLVTEKLIILLQSKQLS